jgi:hypothetical protein
MLQSETCVAYNTYGNLEVRATGLIYLMKTSKSRLLIDLGANKLQGLSLLLQHYPRFQESIVFSLEANPYISKNSARYQEKILNNYPNLQHTYLNCAVAGKPGLVSLNCCSIAELRTPSIKDITHSPKGLFSYMTFYSKKFLKRTLGMEEHIYEASNILCDPPSHDDDNRFDYRPVLIPAVTLEDLIKSLRIILDLEETSFMETLVKIDVEGAEFSALESFLASGLFMDLSSYTFAIEWHERFFDSSFRAHQRRSAIESAIRSRGGSVHSWH